MPRMQFTNRAGLRLAGTLDLPPGGLFRATALFAHCFTCTRNLKAAHRLAAALTAQGIAVLRFDFTGLGESEGDFAETHFSSNLDDLEDAASWLGTHLKSPALLVGHSLGGTAAIAVADRLPGVRAIATLGAPADPEHVLRQFGDRVDTIEREGQAEVLLAGRPFSIRRDFIDDAREHDLADRLRRLRCALLVMHAPDDRVVSIDQASRLFAAAPHPKSFVSLDDADHLLSDETQAHHAGKIIAAWAGRYVDGAIDAPADGIRVVGLTDGGFSCAVQAGRHLMTADEPGTAGGSDLGPDPYGYLSAALGACTVMTLNMYARRKGLAVSEVRCDVSHRKVHAQDCADCQTREGRVDELTRHIRISGGLDAAERQRMLEIADRCPVHRTLIGEIRIRTVAADQDG